MLNDLRKPENVLAVSESLVWWQCPEGHVWRSKIRARVEQGQQPRCPICEGDTSRIKRYARLIRLTYQQLGITPQRPQMMAMKEIKKTHNHHAKKR